MTKVQRWRIINAEDAERPAHIGRLEPDDNGQWVIFDDVANLIQERNVLLEAIRLLTLYSKPNGY